MLGAFLLFPSWPGGVPHSSAEPMFSGIGVPTVAILEEEMQWAKWAGWLVASSSGSTALQLSELFSGGRAQGASCAWGCGLWMWAAGLCSVGQCWLIVWLFKMQMLRVQDYSLGLDVNPSSARVSSLTLIIQSSFWVSLPHLQNKEKYCFIPAVYFF